MRSKDQSSVLDSYCISSLERKWILCLVVMTCVLDFGFQIVMSKYGSCGLLSQGRERSLGGPGQDSDISGPNKSESQDVSLKLGNTKHQRFRN